MKKVIRMTESQLKKIVEQSIKEQSDTPPENTPTKKGWWTVDEPHNKVLVNFLNTQSETSVEYPKDGIDDIEIDGIVVTNDGESWVFWDFKNKINFSSFDVQTNKKLYAGHWDIGRNNYLIIRADDGDTYYTSIGKWSGTDQINVNCAGSLDEIKEGTNKIIKFGCKSDGVKELQELLGMEEKYHTGYFGKITRGKVIEFQKTHKDASGTNLKPDGIVGFKTYQALLSQTKPTEGNTDTNTNTNTSVDNNVEGDFNVEDDFVNENYDNDEFNDNYKDDDIDMLDNIFDTEDDYDGEPLRGDDEGFSNKMRVNQIKKKIKLGDTNMEGGYYMTKDRKKDRENEKRKYAGLDPLRNDDQPEPYSPIRSNDLPLDKYLEKKKMGNLDEDEDIAMLDNLFTKD
jgi:peptidoglycan hydrolase-like protein with peptidoglycan-binding domain